MRNFALTTDGRPPSEIEQALLRVLPGHDVRLWSLGACEAIIGAPLVTAIEDECPGGAGPLLRRLGVSAVRPLSDAATVQLLSAREPGRWRRGLGAWTEPPPTRDWPLRHCGFPSAWARLGGPDTLPWQDLRVGHLDTGYARHPALGHAPGHRSWVDSRRATTVVPRPPLGEASLLVPEPGGGLDTLAGAGAGHGTRVASVLCGDDPDAPGGRYRGAAPRLPLVPVRVADTTVLDEAQRDLARGLDHLVDGGAAVVLIGGGVVGMPTHRSLRAAVHRAAAAGVILVCGAGDHVNGVVAPARLPGCLAVAGVTERAQPWAGSGYGPQVGLSAPACRIPRAIALDAGAAGYADDGDGTAYAAALVAGAAALWLLQHHRVLTERYPAPWQRAAAFSVLAGATASRPPATRWPAGFGAGVLDAAALLDAPLPPPEALPPPPLA